MRVFLVLSNAESSKGTEGGISLLEKNTEAYVYELLNPVMPIAFMDESVFSYVFKVKSGWSSFVPRLMECFPVSNVTLIYVDFSGLGSEVSNHECIKSHWDLVTSEHYLGELIDLE